MVSVTSVIVYPVNLWTSFTVSEKLILCLILDATMISTMLQKIKVFESNNRKPEEIWNLIITLILSMIHSTNTSVKKSFNATLPKACLCFGILVLMFFFTNIEES